MRLPWVAGLAANHGGNCAGTTLKRNIHSASRHNEAPVFDQDGGGCDDVDMNFDFGFRQFLPRGRQNHYSTFGSTCAYKAPFTIESNLCFVTTTTPVTNKPSVFVFCPFKLKLFCRNWLSEITYVFCLPPIPGYSSGRSDDQFHFWIIPGVAATPHQPHPATHLTHKHVDCDGNDDLWAWFQADTSPTRPTRPTLSFRIPRPHQSAPVTYQGKRTSPIAQEIEACSSMNRKLSPPPPEFL